MKIELTQRQFDVLHAKLYGKQDKEIALEHNISTSAIKRQVEKLYRMFNVHGAAEMAEKFGRFELRLEWIPSADAPKVTITKQRERKSVYP